MGIGVQGRFKDVFVPHFLHCPHSLGLLDEGPADPGAHASGICICGVLEAGSQITGWVGPGSTAGAGRGCPGASPLTSGSPPVMAVSLPTSQGVLLVCVSALPLFQRTRVTLDQDPA